MNILLDIEEVEDVVEEEINAVDNLLYHVIDLQTDTQEQSSPSRLKSNQNVLESEGNLCLIH